VREAVVIAREDVPGDKRLVGYVVLKAPGAAEADALRRALREQLPEYMVPSHVVVLERFPLTPNAKVDRKALPAPGAAGAAAAAAPAPVAAPAAVPPPAPAPAPVALAPVPAPAPAVSAAAESALAGTITEVWRSVLNVEQVGADENFFELGGHSLLMVQVQQKLKVALERDLSITDLFRFPTVRTLTRHLAASAPAAADESRPRETPSGLRQTVERAEARREMLLRRRGLRP
jgi:hypothetical protein